MEWIFWMIASVALSVICGVKIREPFFYRGLPDIPADSIPPMPKCKDPADDDHEEISQREALAQLLEKMDEHSRRIVEAVEDLKYGHHGTGPR